MKIDLRAVLAPLIALVILLVIVAQTTGAIRAAGTWAPRPARAAGPVNPYVRIDGLLERAAAPGSAAVRNPFAFGAATRPVTPAVRPRPIQVVLPERPTLTSIVFDADPRATIRYEGRDYAVRQNGLFDEYQVTSITRDQVTLRRNGETLVLQLQRKGE
jgi:hypothetical protein